MPLLENISQQKFLLSDLKKHLEISKKKISRKKYKIRIFTGIGLNKGFPS